MLAKLSWQASFKQFLAYTKFTCCAIKGDQKQKLIDFIFLRALRGFPPSGSPWHLSAWQAAVNIFLPENSFYCMFF
jgi:hypothetical protein